MRMRTIASAAEYFKNLDPDTAITQYAIRKAVLSGFIPYVRAGKKYLVGIENLAAYFSGDMQTESPHPLAIRAVKQ